MRDFFMPLTQLLHVDLFASRFLEQLWIRQEILQHLGRLRKIIAVCDAV